MIDWSNTNLPLPSALSVTNRSAALRKKAESGRYLQRRRFTTSYEEGTIQFKFLNEQFQIFKGVWVHYLDNGTASFTIDLPVGGSTRLTNCEVKFIADYSYQYVSVDYVTVQCKIEFKEVTAPNKLETDNLINLGDIYLQREAETVEVVFTNIDGSSTPYVRCTLLSSLLGPLPQATQFWDGTINLNTGTANVFKYLEPTVSEEEFVIHHYPTYNTTNPAPNPDGKFGYFTVANGQTNLKRWDPNATPSYYWRSINLTNATNYVPPSAGQSFRYHITDNFERLSMVNADLIKKVILTCEDNAVFGYQNTTDDLFIQYCDLLDEVTVNIAPNNVGALYSRLRIDGMNGLQTCNLSGMMQYAPSSVAYTRVINNPTLQTLTLGGNPDYVQEYVDLSSNDLTTINVYSGYRWVSGNTGSFLLRNNNFTVNDLLSMVDLFKGSPTVSPSANSISLSGNPCWQGNQIFPVAFANPMSISSITSTSTDFTVTTSSNHNLSPNDPVFIQTTVGAYNRAWYVATTPTSTTFTVTDDSNAGTASGGTVSFESSATSAELIVRAAYNNYTFIA